MSKLSQITNQRKRQGKERLERATEIIIKKRGRFKEMRIKVNRN